MNTQLDLWELFCELCKQVVEEQNVFLDVFIGTTGIEMTLMPYTDEE